LKKQEETRKRLNMYEYYSTTDNYRYLRIRYLPTVSIIGGDVTYKHSEDS